MSHFMWWSVAICLPTACGRLHTGGVTRRVPRGLICGTETSGPGYPGTRAETMYPVPQTDPEPVVDQ